MPWGPISHNYFCAPLRPCLSRLHNGVHDRLSDLDNCNFVDSDAEGISACFETFGKADIERL